MKKLSSRKRFRKLSTRMTFKNKIGSILWLTSQLPVRDTHDAFLTRELVRSLYKDCDRWLKYSGAGLTLEEYMENKECPRVARQ